MSILKEALPNLIRAPSLFISLARLHFWLFEGIKIKPTLQVVVFYVIRMFLALISVVVDAALVVAVSRKYGKRLASYALAMLCLASGCFFASTSLLPSSFAMYAMSLASAFYLFEKPAMAVASAATGVILGWPFSILAFLPVTIYSLMRNFKRAFMSGVVTSTCLAGLSVIVDFFYYGKWTSSVLNLLLYNVLGGGESHLYGVEGPLFYLKNGFNNFNFCFLFALLFPGIIPIAKKKYAPDFLVIVSPVYLWIAFMSLQPHKEERLAGHLLFAAYHHILLFVQHSAAVSPIIFDSFSCII